MSTAITSGTYPRASAPLGVTLRRFGKRFWAALNDMGARRAAPQLNLLALQYQHSNPKLAEQLRTAAREALVRKG